MYYFEMMKVLFVFKDYRKLLTVKLASLFVFHSISCKFGRNMNSMLPNILYKAVRNITWKKEMKNVCPDYSPKIVGV